MHPLLKAHPSSRTLSFFAVCCCAPIDEDEDGDGDGACVTVVV